MKEDLLHFAWRLGRFDQKQLKTTEGAPISLMNTGYPNPNAGPDFLEARMRIGDTLWAGCVEMHVRSSDWYRHNHQHDPAYQNVILHVVLEEDQKVFLPKGTAIPCLVLKNRIEKGLFRKYARLLNEENWIPCQPFFQEANPDKFAFWLERLAVERLADKTTSIAKELEAQKGDWETVFFQWIAQTLSGKINKPAARALLDKLPYSLLRKYRHRLFTLEALLFGHSGLIHTEPGEDYPGRLKTEYRFLATKHQLKPIPATLWKFMRMRPANFPTLRLAQLATLLHCNEHLFSKAMAAKGFREVENLFNIEVSQYWKTHYRFGKPSRPTNKRLGKTTIRALAINVVAPFQFLYGQLRQQPGLKDRALQLWEEIPPEQNNILRHWKELGVEVDSAQRSQALLQLKNEYCDTQRCLECPVGQTILDASSVKSD